jgi:hypothetical protein
MSGALLTARFPKTMVPTIGQSVGQESAFAGGSIAGGASEIATGTLKCLDGSLAKERKKEAPYTVGK